MFRFKCASCNEWHEGMPAFGADAPLYYYGIPEEERADRCKLTSDTCVVDDQFYFVRGCIEITVLGYAEAFSWGAWVSLSKENFNEYTAKFDLSDMSHIGPFFGWLSANFRVYPDTENLKTMLHPRDAGRRPYIEIEPTEHPLAIEQQNGVSIDRVAEIYAAYMHTVSPN